MAKNKITELDFDGIKDNLKLFLKSQTEFSDYNFEGSGMNVLLDILAYNTHYLAYNLNFSSSEMFLDTAVLKSTISSHAKTLGYLPRSSKAPIAYLNVTINNPEDLSTATITKGTKFSSDINNSTYSFLVNEDVTINKQNGVLEFLQLPIYEGTLVTTRYSANSNNLQQKFILDSDKVDISTLKVSVQNSLSDNTTRTFTRVEDITNENSDSLIYFLQQTSGSYEVYFGDGIVGKALDNGNIIILEYIVTNEFEANGAFEFTFSGSISGKTDVTVVTSEISQGGMLPETNDSIKTNSRLNNTAKNRAVTTQDYKTILSKIYPNASSVSVWGGEDNDPPIYGKIFISIKPKNIITLNSQAKENIITDLKKYTIASVLPEIVDYETTKVICTTSFEYDEKSTIKTNVQLENDVISKAQTYNTTLSNFGTSFKNSVYAKNLQDADDSIVSVSNKLKIIKTFIPTLNSSLKYTLDFNNQLFHPSASYNADNGGIVSSTGFKVSGNTNTIFLDDDGDGNIRSYYLSASGANIIKNFVNRTVGTINYVTGKIEITLNVTEVIPPAGSTNTTTIELTTEPDNQNIFSIRNQLVQIDFEKSTFTSNSISG